MIGILRKNQQGLMIALTILVIIAFVFLFNTTKFDRAGSRTAAIIGKIYDHSVSQTEYEREARKFGLARGLQLVDLLGALIGRAQSEDQAVDNFVWNSLVLRHEAARLQIQPTDEEVAAALKNVAAFQTNGAFDSGKYADFLQNRLSPNGFTTEQLEDLIRDDLRLKKIRAVLNATFAVSPAAFREDYVIRNQKTDVNVIRFSLAELAAGIQVSDDDVKKKFEQRKAELNTDEKRKVKFAALALSDDEKKLTGKERIDALQKLANRANDFTQAMLEKDAKFDDVAAKFQAKIGETKLFAQSAPDEALAQTAGAAEAAFKLTKQDPNSDVIQGETGFYILQLEDIVPSRPLTFDEARPQIIDQIKNSRAQEQLSTKAAEIRTKIQADMKAGKSFADAAALAGQKPGKYPPFSLSDPNFEATDSREVMTKSLELGEGQLSDFVPTQDGGVLVFLEKREPIDEAKFEKDKVLALPQFAQQKQTVVFLEWLRKQRENAKIQGAEKPAQS